MKSTPFLFYLIIMLSACSQVKHHQALITGQIRNAENAVIILQELGTKEIHNLDSVNIDAGGGFTFQLIPPETGFYMLKAPSGKVLVMMIGQGDTIQLGGDFSEFPDKIELRANKEASLLHDFFLFTRINEKAVDSLEMLLVEMQDSAGYYKLTESADTAFQKIWYRQKAYEESFINQNPGSLASLIVLNYSFGMSPVLSPDEDFGFYLKLDSGLARTNPGNKHVIYHHQRVSEYQRQMELKKMEK